MYLKSIEVNGFKSFAHKLIFQFHDGITGIVGPNGSGKSNVADAVRWVLGEQSAKQLRGAKMEDVIFSGTEMRKPMGSAFVAITMDNSDHSLPIDYDEVTVARRVYRSGESEYLINGSPCRRRDIVELFFDTGIGKEGYSIIGQGQIDQILSGKPEDRRELFDEAAGIVKYKKNKLQTQKSLDAERENLSRVTDILSELERQVGPLKHQSEKAKEYLAYREQLKEEDIQMFLLENENISGELKGLDEKVSIAREEVDKANRELEQSKKQYEEEDQKLESLKEKAQSLNDKIGEEKLSKEKQEGEIKVLEEQINTEKTKEQYFESNISRLKEEAASKEAQLEEIRVEKEKLSKKADLVEKERVEKESKVAFLEKDIQDTQKELEDFRLSISDFTDSQLDLAGRLERYETVKEQLSLRLSNLDSQIKALREELVAQEEKTNQEQKNLEVLQKEEKTHRKTLEKEESACREKKQQADSLGKQLSEKTETRHRMESNYETLRNMAERYDGYGFGIKRVMECRDTTPGIIGAVADIIKVEKKYETAVETALGASIQNIVTDSAKTAKEMIAYLKKNRYGRVTFLPLDTVKSRGQFSRPEALKETGVMGTADTLVSFEDRFSDLFRSILGRILVVDHIDNGMAIARKYHHSFRIVTLEGDSLNPGGSMSGGAFKNKSNLLGRNREVKDLEKKLDLIRNEAAGAQKAYEEGLKEVSACEDRIIAVNEQLQKNTLDQNTIRMTLESVGRRSDEFKRRLETFASQKKTLEDERDMNVDQVSQLMEEKASLEDANKSDEEKITALEQMLDEKRSHAEEQAHEITDVHMRAGQLRQQIDFADSNMERVREEFGKSKEELKTAQDQAKHADAAVEEIYKQIEECKDSISKKELWIIEQTKAAKVQQENIDQISDDYKNHLLAREEIMERSGGYEKELVRLENLRDKQEEKQQELMNYMWDNYELTYNNAKNLGTKPEQKSLTAIKESINELKTKIRELGPVNVNALEDYKEVAERYEFLLQQHEDITKAEEHLVGLIGELEDAMRRQFHEKFKDIQDMFQQVFQELFGGGHARLELTDDDILEAGVRIIAQPPGKKLQNMMQLSGGEKALTAISLLFAIQNLKPSPFCLLDEIEAALDDSNVTRFAQYLHKLTKDTQFIVITHRRGTMTAADILYGITMQEKGVSTQVSVNLIEEDLDE